MQHTLSLISNQCALCYYKVSNICFACIKHVSNSPWHVSNQFWTNIYWVKSSLCEKQKIELLDINTRKSVFLWNDMIVDLGREGDYKFSFSTTWQSKEKLFESIKILIATH